MREILFRGQWIKNSDWVEGYYVLLHGIHYIVVTEDDDWEDGEWFEVYPETIGQYTGMTDKDGNKIFEHDVIGGDEEMCATMYNRNTGAYTHNTWTNKDVRYLVEFTPSSLQLISAYAKRFKIIGNIHNNPSLFTVCS